MADVPHYEMYIDGRWAGAAETFEVRSPARGELVATVAQGDLASVDAAVAAARAAHGAACGAPGRHTNVPT